MATVFLGNTAPVQAPVGTSASVNGEQVAGPAPVENTLGEKTIVVVTTPDFNEGQQVPLDKKLTEIRNAFSVHSSAPAAWVEGHDDFFNQAVSQIFGCPVGRPADWDAPQTAPEPVSAPPAAPAAPVVQDVQTNAQEA